MDWKLLLKPRGDRPGTAPPVPGVAEHGATLPLRAARGPIVEIVASGLRAAVRGRGARAALRDGLAIPGYLLALFAWPTLLSGITRVAGDTQAYLRAGHALLEGAPVYVGHYGMLGAFSYAPPWALLFVPLALMPPIVAQIVLTAANVAALRYVAGSWRGVGYALLWPVTLLYLPSGNIDLLIAAAMVAAWRGRAWPLAFAGLAKVAPFLGIPHARWREAALTVALAIACTLPWLHLWPEWIAYLLRQPPSIGFSVSLAWWMRLPVALALVILVRRPWAAALAVVVAMPFLYLFTTMEGLAVVRLWVDGRRAAAVRG